MKILTKEEFDILSLVNTPVEYAKKILERNAPILDFLETLPTTEKEIKEWKRSFENKFGFTGNVGCPHCRYGYGKYFCHSCDWQKVLSFENILFKCTKVTFGGISHTKVCRQKFVDIEYAFDFEQVYGHLPRIKEDGSFDQEDIDTYLLDLEGCKTFVKGHIEWAEEIIKQSKERKNENEQ